jgi:hypothetical protein
MLSLKKVLILFFLGFFILINGEKAFGTERQLLILYTGDVKGYVEGCG